MYCLLKNKFYIFLSLQLLINAAAAAEFKYENIGRPATTEEVQAADIAIGTEGKELPPGRGTAREGETIFKNKCVQCHTYSPGSPAIPLAMIGPWWPYATTIWDYIHRAMPLNEEGTLTDDEVYALTAYVLNISGVIKDDYVLSKKTLPAIKMPARDNYFPDPRDLEWDPDDHREYGLYEIYPELTR